jgi:ferredoxin
MDRLQLLDAGLRAFDASLPGVAPPLCLVTRYRASSCRRCLDVCPTAAVEPAPWLRLVPERCSSCGACAAVCPTGALAFSARSETLRERLCAIAAGGGYRVALACRLVELDDVRAEAAPARRGNEGDWGHDDGEVVVVPCLGALSAAELIGAAAAGLSDLTLVSAGCEACRERTAGLAADDAVDRAVATVAALGGRLSVTRRSAPRAAGGHDEPEASAGPALSRRDLFAFLARGARRTAAEGLAPARRTIADLHGQAPPPARHGRLRADLGTLADRGGVGCAAPPAVALPVALPLARLEVGQGCTGCDLCVRYCPHGALALAGGVPRCDESLCTGCGLCVEVCPPAALVLRPVTAGSLPSPPAGVP